MSFQRAVAFVLAREKGFWVDPVGGPTNLGIALNRHPELTLDDIKAMTPQRASAIYEGRDYFGAVKGYQLPDYAQLLMLDACVMSGPQEAIKWLQRALFVRDDGELGAETLKALGLANPRATTERFSGERIWTLSTLKNWPQNAVGWASRVNAASIEAQTS